MESESYERLANALEALPGGFPKTASGVELRLLEKAFAADEAAIAGQMTRTYETIEELAIRVAMPGFHWQSGRPGLIAEHCPRCMWKVPAALIAPRVDAENIYEGGGIRAYIGTSPLASFSLNSG